MLTLRTPIPESYPINQGASRVSRPGNALYADICRLSTPKLTFLEKTFSAGTPGEKARAQHSGPVPATGIWDLSSSKPLLFKDCSCLSGFRKKEGKSQKLKSRPTKGIVGPGPIQIEKLPSHIQERFPPKGHRKGHGDTNAPQLLLFKVTRPKEGHSVSPPPLTLHHVYPLCPHLLKPQVFPSSRECWVLDTLSHPIWAGVQLRIHPHC